MKWFTGLAMAMAIAMTGCTSDPPTPTPTPTPEWKYSEAEIRRLFEEKCPDAVFSLGGGVNVPIVKSKTVVQSTVPGTWTVSITGTVRAGDRTVDGTVHAADPPPDVFEMRESTLVPVPVGTLRGLTRCR